MVRFMKSGQLINDFRGLPLIWGTLVEEGHPLVGEGHTQMSFRRAKMPLLVGSYFIPPLQTVGFRIELSKDYFTMFTYL